MKPDIGSDSQFLPTQPAFDAPLGGGGPVEILPYYGMAIFRRELEWLGYPMVKIF